MAFFQMLAPHKRKSWPRKAVGPQKQARPEPQAAAGVTLGLRSIIQMGKLQEAASTMLGTLRRCEGALVQSAFMTAHPGAHTHQAGRSCLPSHFCCEAQS